MQKKARTRALNPIIYSDFPDPDIIRVGDTYYMASTTMHFMPGCDILRSYDLLNWELLSQVYDELDTEPSYRLDGDLSVYGKGMWAPTLRYNGGYFYLLFTSNDTQKTHLFRAAQADGEWERIDMEGFYYDSSLFFDDDGKAYIVHGPKTIRLTELKADLSGPEPNGLDRIIAVDEDEVYFGYEGLHMYKHEGRYYIFTCHMLSYGNCRKTQHCFVSDSLTGDFIGRCIIDDDQGYFNRGVAQGGMVDTPDGDWFCFMFQDRGALGRAPYLMPMTFDADGFPAPLTDGCVPHIVEAAPSTRPEHTYEPLNGDDDFRYLPDGEGKINLKKFWQFNHNPDNGLWSVTEREGALRIRSGKVCSSIMQARNTLTQRTTGPHSAAEITVDAALMNDGDYAGICAFQGCYAFAAITKNDGGYFLVMAGKPAEKPDIYGEFGYTDPPAEFERIPLSSPTVRLRMEADFSDSKDECEFFFEKDGAWNKIGITHKLYFKLDHFTGCRFALFMYSTGQCGGAADFADFRYFDSKEKSSIEK